MQDTLAEVREVVAAEGDLCTVFWKLLEPEGYVADYVIVRTFAGILPDTVHIVLATCAVNRDTDAQMAEILPDESLNGRRVIVYAVGGETEAV